MWFSSQIGNFSEYIPGTRRALRVGVSHTKTATRFVYNKPTVIASFSIQPPKTTQKPIFSLLIATMNLDYDGRPNPQWHHPARELRNFDNSKTYGFCPQGRFFRYGVCWVRTSTTWKLLYNAFKHLKRNLHTAIPNRSNQLSKLAE